MKSAFFFGSFFPPPAPFAFMLPGKNWPGTWFTTNAYIAFLMKFIVWNIVLSDVIPDLFGCPVGQRIELHKCTITKCRINFSYRYFIFCRLPNLAVPSRSTCRSIHSPVPVAVGGGWLP